MKFTLVGAGGGEGAMDAANILKPSICKRRTESSGATTLNEYQKYFEKIKLLERRFQKSNGGRTRHRIWISILRGLKTNTKRTAK